MTITFDNTCGYTDFRKQVEVLIVLVNLKFGKDPYSGSCVFLFCNRQKNSIKALRWDSDGFLLATKRLVNEMRFNGQRMLKNERKELEMLRLMVRTRQAQLDEKRWPAIRIFYSACFP